MFMLGFLGISLVVSGLIVMISPYHTRTLLRGIGGAGVLLFMPTIILDLRDGSLASYEQLSMAIVQLVVVYYFSSAVGGVVRPLAIRLGVRCKLLGGVQASFGIVPAVRASHAAEAIGTATLNRPAPPALCPREGAFVLSPKTPLRLLDDGCFRIKLPDLVNNEMSEEFRRQSLRAIESNAERIRIELDSVGGLVREATMIRLMIRELIELNHIQVEILVKERCMSAAVSILTCVPLDNRYCLSTARFLVHHISADVGADRSNEDLAQQLTAETNIDPESLSRLLSSGTDYYFTPEEAVKLGVVGHIL